MRRLLTQIKLLLKILKGSNFFFVKATGSVVMRFVSIASQFLVTVSLARYLGVEGFGNYSLVFSAITLITMITQFGLPLLVIRETSKTNENKNWSLMSGLWSWSLTFSTTAALLIFVISSFVILSSSSTTLVSAIWIYGLLLGSVTALLNINGAMLIGLGYTILGQVTTLLLKPGLFLILIFMSSTFWFTSFHAEDAMILHFIAVGISLLVGILLLRQRKPLFLKKAIVKEYQTKAWLKSMIPLSMTEGLLQLNLQAGILILGMLAGPLEVGIYRLASQLALLTLFVRIATIPLIAPQIALFSETENLTELQKIIKLQSRLSFIAALFAILIFILLGHQVIELMGGADFSDAYTPLIITAIGFAFAAYIGPGEFFLVMTGSERLSVIILSFSVLLNICLIVALVPYFGVVGAALGTAVSFAARAIAIAVVAKRTTGINICAI